MEQPFLLELDGQLAGRFFDFKGGGFIADVILLSNPGLMTHKQIDDPDFHEMVLACGTGMSRSFYDWISSTFQQEYARRSGAIITLDRFSKPTARLNFQRALVTSLAMPALDASSKDPAYMTVTIKPERTSSIGPTASQSVGAYSSAIPKAWETSSFRIKIDGLETECQHVTKIEALRLKQGIVKSHAGERRHREIEPAAIEVSDLVFELPKSFTGRFDQWFKSSVVEGQNPGDEERNGTLDFLAPRTATSYFGLKLNGLQIYRMTRSGASIKFVMHCTKMEFSASGAAVK